MRREAINSHGSRVCENPVPRFKAGIFASLLIDQPLVDDRVDGFLLNGAVGKQLVGEFSDCGPSGLFSKVVVQAAGFAA